MKKLSNSNVLILGLLFGLVVGFMTTFGFSNQIIKKISDAKANESNNQVKALSYSYLEPKYFEAFLAVTNEFKKQTNQPSCKRFSRCNFEKYHAVIIGHTEPIHFYVAKRIHPVDYYSRGMNFHYFVDSKTLKIVDFVDESDPLSEWPETYSYNP